MSNARWGEVARALRGLALGMALGWLVLRAVGPGGSAEQSARRRPG